MSRHHHKSTADSREQGWPDSEQIELRSVGIDIGSSTSHLLFSRIKLRRRGVALSSGFSVVEREVLYSSPVLLTPYQDVSTIDVSSLDKFIDGCYRQAGITRDGVDSGAVIITGEAAKKENAANILALFAAEGGNFVCASAGPLLEARLACYGSGAVTLSANNYPDKQILNVDIGGGTTKISLLKSGVVEKSMAVNIGARLLAWNEEGSLVRMEEAGKKIAGACGLNLNLGDSIPFHVQGLIAAKLADLLWEWLGYRPLSRLAEDLLVTEGHFVPPDESVLVFSGGVGEYVYGAENRAYGDLGKQLGALIAGRLQDEGLQVIEGSQQLRATVIGASQYTLQVSGNTIFLTGAQTLPLRNLPVVHVDFEDSLSSPGQLAECIVRTVALHEVDNGEGQTALFIKGKMVVSYPMLRCLGEGIAEAGRRLGLDTLVVLLQQDIAGALGHILYHELAYPNVLCLDQLEAGDLDFIDIGQVIEDVGAVPVVIKSLVYK